MGTHQLGRAIPKQNNNSTFVYKMTEVDTLHTFICIINVATIVSFCLKII